MATELSRQLYDILDAVGASRRMRCLHTSTAKTAEVLQTILMKSSEKSPISVCYFGSTFEGSVTPRMMSDADVLYCHDKMPIVQEARAGETGNAFLLVRDEFTCPGYVKLQRVKNGFPLNINISDGAEHCRADRDGRFCLSNLAEEVKCQTVYGPTLSNNTDKDEQRPDILGAFVLKDTPDSYQKGLVRTRKYGWPSADHLTEIGRLGCYVVAVGSEIREERDIEWRISFTMAERLLMTSLTTTQHKVFILLKMIIKQLTGDRCSEKIISSYQCKTCMMFVVENTVPNNWRPDNIINCLIVCLAVLIRMLQIGNCPDYFIPQRNLLLSKTRRARLALAAELHSLLMNRRQLVHRLHTDKIGPMIRHERFTQMSDIAVTEAGVMEFKIKWSVMKHSFAEFLLNAKPYRPEDLTHLLENMLKFETALGLKEKGYRKAVVCIKPWIHLHIALSIASRVCSKLPDLSAERGSVKEIDQHLKEALRADLVASTLSKASILLKLKRYKTCLKLLQSVEEKLTPDIMSRCTCHSDEFEINFSERQMLRTSGMSISAIMATSVASCIIFLHSEKDIAPEPLSYEMERSAGEATGPTNYWSEWAVVDAKVFLFFMQYVVNSRLRRHTGKSLAIDNLAVIINRDINLGHQETAFNLLGWIYLQENRLDSARECFRKSLDIRPNRNAANRHLRDMQYFHFHK